jgi:uncharacterized repeat protein (TIGR01451 family)
MNLSRFGFIIQKLILDATKPSVVIGSIDNYGLVEFEVAPDLDVALTSAPATLALGGSGSATARVSSLGPYAGSAVTLNVSIPTGTTAVVTPPQGTCTQTGSSFQCALGAVQIGQPLDTVIALTGGNAPGSGTLAVTVAGHESDPVSSNNSAQATVDTKRVANLGVTLVPSAAAVDHNTPVTLTATATNAGPNAANAATVTIALGTGMTYQSSTASQGICVTNNGTVTCSLGALAPSAQATVTVVAIAASLGALAPSAQIADNGVVDPAAANNTASANVTSRSVADARIEITDNVDPVASGQAVQYTATVSNSGPDDLPTTTVTINVTGSTVTGATSSQGSCSTAASSVTCTLTTLPASGSATITISATAGSAGTATANASVAFQGTDTGSGNNSGSQSTVVNAPPSGGSGGGGGGANGPFELLALLGLLWWVRRASHLRTA